MSKRMTAKAIIKAGGIVPPWSKVLRAFEVALKMNSGEKVNANWGFDELEPDFHRRLDAEMMATGWKVWDNTSSCSKAVRESNWEKNGVKVNIVTANFLGMFTQVASF